MAIVQDLLRCLPLDERGGSMKGSTVTNVLPLVLVSLLHTVRCDDRSESYKDSKVLLAHFTPAGSLILVFLANMFLEI